MRLWRVGDRLRGAGDALLDRRDAVAGGAVDLRLLGNLTVRVGVRVDVGRPVAVELDPEVTAVQLLDGLAVGQLSCQLLLIETTPLSETTAFSAGPTGLLALPQSKAAATGAAEPIPVTMTARTASERLGMVMRRVLVIRLRERC
jgi:hypothetical protein